eukprot:CAMPEP_0172434066 /NCGR_PEP_ID=MMETSP1064-20121228/70434_1 /TAXON_ID=202472 /ORGANISM="Aulacoseira subarctica , Strain CCAP 1002/5" /LENGTH=2137 /DNA_ID=CAMNT_0013182263 /DNA_START=101 /DNA_END=6514 /DNA_ORIENTATION=-
MSVEYLESSAWPLTRVVGALVTIWITSRCNSDPRACSGVISAVVVSIITFVHLESLFEKVDLALSDLAPYFLALVGSAVGMALGVLVPYLASGACLGAVLSILLCSLGMPGFFAITLTFAVAGALIGVKWRGASKVINICASALIGGALAACLVYPPLFYYVTKVIVIFSNLVASTDATSSSLNTQPFMGVIWIAAALVTCVPWFLFSGGASEILGFIRGTSDSTDAERARLTGQTSSEAKRLSFAAPKPHLTPHMNSSNNALPDAFNMFDPAELPPRLAEYANMVYSACEDLGNFFGFQDASVRNQAEHLLILLSNHRRYMTVLPLPMQPPSPIHALHAKVFSNYMKWCKAMGIAPCFSRMNPLCVSGPPAAVSRVVDLVLYFCIWGEGANLRHMPECLWFIYHKMMESYCRYEGYTQTRSLYAGHFLDHVIAPVYAVAKKNMSSKADHIDKLNYDDINEFFWSRQCLQYRYYSSDESASLDLESAALDGTSLEEQQVPIAEALGIAHKTFLEKRSWLRGIIALNRIVEWHMVTFYILTVIAFSNNLVWGWVFTVQALSGAFWVLNALHLNWCLLDVWCVFPGIHLSSSAICGSVFCLISRFLILIYQTLYLVYTFGPKGNTYFGIQASSNFWWWQYIWLSLLCMVPYFIDSFLQCFSVLSTKLLMSQNDYVQSFLNVLFPLSRLYVGKEVHESFKHTMSYAFFWITLIAWKLYFSYIFEVDAMVLPTLQLTDDYINLPDQNFITMALILLLRWTPQFIVYLIDSSIWYSVWQAFAGTGEGFADHLGDVRSLSDIRSAFVRAPEIFCQKMLSPDAGSRRGSSASFLGTNASNTDVATENSSLLGSDPHKLQGYVNRLLNVRIQKWVMFSAVWNEIIDHFRQEDIISDRERELLKFSRFDGFSQAIYLPVFQTAGVIENAMIELERPKEESSNADEQIFKPIVENIIMRTAVSEVWELGNFLFVKMLGPLHKNDVVAVTNVILKWTENCTLCEHLQIEKMRPVLSNFLGMIASLERSLRRRKPSSKPRTSSRVKRSADPGPSSSKGMRRVMSATSLNTAQPEDRSMNYNSANQPASGKEKRKAQDVVILDALRDEVRDKLRGLINALKGLVKNVSKDRESRDVLDRLTFVMSMENGFLWDDAYASDQLDEISKDGLVFKVLTKLYGLTVCLPDDVEPKSKEVRRRLTFFFNSLFMNMPEAPSIHDMFSWNVLTPFYSEDVTYSKNDLEERKDALGVTTLLYLQTLYKTEWSNFLERLNIKDGENVWSKKYVDETRLWASLRSQTLTRTVTGMMYYEKALRLLANLERLDDITTEDLMGEKFGYIVACQVYGKMKKEQDPKADDIEKLMHRYPLMRVAYIDNVRLNRLGDSIFYSVLVKSDGKGKIQEIYRVRLPGDPILGEGKPENQNHALIFSRGEFVQTIDMNQEGYFEEALKMRNALQEFAKREGPLPTTILGLREHIFTGSVSSLANYMALQETSFVTLGQRVLAKPLRIRLHYGHPDVFDKLFFMTRGGISKSSKGINLSEDIFAGYNNVIRGGQVAFIEYLQVGKGRDVGMSQIYKFEAKLSQGAAEQSLSRDVYRVAHRLDFFRLLSLYYGGIGHYFSNVLTVLTVYVVVYLMAILALFDMEIIGERAITPMGTIQMCLGGLGLMQTIPLFATLGVERGWLASAKEIFQVFVTGGPLHFMFHIQTKAYYMSQTILVGGAKYRPTGRGFVTQHTPFDEQYRFFASSHLYLGVEMAAGLILMGMFTGAKQYFGRTWSLWLASLSFLASPFWFNPLSFDWEVVTSDYEKFLRWMLGSTGGVQKSWSAWWNDENSHYKSIKLEGRIIYWIKSILFLVMAEGIRRSNLMEDDTMLHKPLISISKVVIMIFVLLGLGQIYAANEHMLPYPVRRTIGILICIGLIGAIFTVFLEDTNFLRYSLASYYGIGALCQIGLLYGVKFVKQFYFMHDLVCGHIMFVPLFILSALQLPRFIQTWLLYHNALSTDVVVSDILRYARKSMDSAGLSEPDPDLVDQVEKLRKIVQMQEEVLSNAGLLKSSSTLDLAAEAGPSTSPAALVNPSPVVSDFQPRREEGFAGKRVMSMSGLDVWGDMALGGTTTEGTANSLGGYGAQNVYTPAPKVPGFSFSQPDTMPPR